MKRKKSTQSKPSRIDYFMALQNEIKVVSLEQARREKKKREKELDAFIKSQ